MNKTFEQAYEAFCIKHLKKLDELILKYAKLLHHKDVTLSEAYDFTDFYVVNSLSFYHEKIYIKGKHVLTVDEDKNIKEVYDGEK